MRRPVILNVVLALAVVAIVALALVVDARRSGSHDRFVGSDSVATSVIEEENPGFEPWFSSIIPPMSSEVESGLFALQAALGGMGLGYCLGALRRRRQCDAGRS